MNATCLALGLRTDSLHLHENMWPNSYNSQQDRLALLILGLHKNVVRYTQTNVQICLGLVLHLNKLSQEQADLDAEVGFYSELKENPQSIILNQVMYGECTHTRAHTYRAFAFPFKYRK